MPKPKPDPTPLTTLQVADKLKATVRAVQRWRAKLKLGTMHGRDWLLTDADAKVIAKHVGKGAGNPDFGPDFAGRKKRKQP